MSTKKKKRDGAHLRHKAEPGYVFGAWTLVEYIGQTKYGQNWRARCVCGAEKIKKLAELKKNNNPCRACSARRRVADGTQSRAGLRGMTGRYGDHEAFALRELGRFPSLPEGFDDE